MRAVRIHGVCTPHDLYASWACACPGWLAAAGRFLQATSRKCRVCACAMQPRGLGSIVSNAHPRPQLHLAVRVSVPQCNFLSCTTTTTTTSATTVLLSSSSGIRICIMYSFFQYNGRKYTFRTSAPSGCQNPQYSVLVRSQNGDKGVLFYMFQSSQLRGRLFFAGMRLDSGRIRYY